MMRVAFAAAIASLFAATSAHAKPEYPGMLQEQIGTSCIVHCMTCHTSPEGGIEYLRTVANPPFPFGAVLGQIVSSMSKDFTTIDRDSDVDGMKDLEELKLGRDPLIPGASSICSPSYGCGARLAQSPLSDDSVTTTSLLAAAAALIWFGRRRAKPRAS